jgi:alkanesulfonate monooxygenase SsuD/methylene tetrahydromethanopterin reductase-like flavin-dependent oxidoreductase (luciferase family)
MDWKYGDMGAARGSRMAKRPPPVPAEAEERLRRNTLAGTPEEVAESILAYGDILGTEGTYVARLHLPGLDPSVAAEARRVFAEEVLPLVRGAA